MKRTRFTAIILSAVLAITPAAPVMAEATTTETVQSQDGWNGLYYIKNGKKVNGLQKIGNKQYYFKSYKLVKTESTGTTILTKRALSQSGPATMSWLQRGWSP